MKKFILAFLAAVILCACTGEKPLIVNLDSLNTSSTILGVGESFGDSHNLVKERFPNAQIQFFLNTPYEAVETGKIDGYVVDRCSLDYVCAANDKLAVLDEGLADINVCVATANESTELMAQVNEFIKQYTDDGIAEDMYKRWILQKQHDMPDIKKPENPVKTLKIITNGLSEPMNFFKGTEIWGYDIEFIKRFTAAYNYDYEIVTMDYPAMSVALMSNKADMIISNFFYSAERAEIITYSDPYMVTEMAILVNKDRLPKK